MRRPAPLCLTAILLLAACASGAKDGATRGGRPAVAGAMATPPVAKRVPVTSELHGIRRVDEYAWLARKDSPEVLEYLRAENAYTEAMTRPTAPLRQRLYAEMLARIKQTDVSVPSLDNGYWYYAVTREGSEHPIYCRKQGTLEAAEEVLLDLNALRKGEKFLSLGDMEVSDDGGKLASSVDVSGFRDYTLRIKDLATGKDAAEAIEHVASFVWAADNRTLLYTTEDAAKRSHRLWRHTLGTDPKDDRLLYEEKDERFTVAVSRTRDDRYLLMNLQSATTSEWRFLDARKPDGAWAVIEPRRQDHEYDVEHRDGTLWIRTNDRGRHFRLVTAPVASPGHASWKEVVPHRDDVMLQGFDLFAGHYVLLELANALPRLIVVPLDKGERWTIPTEEAVYSVDAAANHEFGARTFRYSFTSFTTPNTVYEVDVASRARTLLKRHQVLGSFDPSHYTSERTTATAADGTAIPVSLVYRKDRFRKDGKSPMLLTGYGAYGLTYDVTFSSERLSLLDRGVVFAIAHIRGGGDLGKQWHDGGRMMTKKNSFTDFVAVAEHLQAAGYTAKDRLVISGASAGGLLMGAVVNMRPDLFKGVVAGVPFVDVINTMLDESLPLTVGEFEEWGNPREKAAYDCMASYSPYDNVTAQALPAMLVISAYNDSQVLYHEPAKWVARMRATRTDHNPLLLKMDLDPAGHGGKSGRYEQLRDDAFETAWILSTLRLE